MIFIHGCFARVVGGNRLGIIALIVIEQKTEIADAAFDILLRVETVRDAETPGGGGWGRTSERSGELVASDLAEGLITPEAAPEVYCHTRSTATAAE